MFTVTERAALRRSLVDRARADPDVIAAAVLGSGASGEEDDWSDIDLALCLRPDADQDRVVQRWTDVIFAEHGAVHRLDVAAAGALYRVFLLESSLQLDLSFWPAAEFRPHGPTFRLLFGEALPPAEKTEVDPARTIGLAWLYGLHVRSALARDRTWQAVIMLDHLRDQVLQLACLRHGLNPHQGRGVDLLPAEVLTAVATARAGSVETAELTRSAAALLELLARETAAQDRVLAGVLEPVLRQLGEVS
ncbi:nucleotidyltransferase domain-containing protein [Microlunatus speluncae]|uniref:nucleotidyltransferase domain-containing protein n=1 Tax=Microlunatus speluncae TaxID=2594267 RepID=UPI0012667234|nr:nucleotidyltransferase domain-containing protein [Microlunatus speluncae]